MSRRFENDEEIKRAGPIVLIACLMVEPVDLNYMTLEQRRTAHRLIREWAESLP